jgi:hypothetical protein
MLRAGALTRELANNSAAIVYTSSDPPRGGFSVVTKENSLTLWNLSIYKTILLMLLGQGQDRKSY